MAGRRWLPLWALHHHRGRRSGREYAVPVGVRVTDGGFYIGPPFGERTQWVHNVLAAGGCSLRWRARDVELTDPAIVGYDEAAPAFNIVLRWMLRMVGVTRFIRLHPAAAGGVRPPADA